MLRPGSVVFPVLLLSALGRAGCKSPTEPTPPPKGKPNSTAFENLPLIRTLEAASGRQTLLVSIRGPALQSGIVAPGSAWQYLFGEPVGGSEKLYAWSVWSDGAVRFAGEGIDVHRVTRRELGPFLKIDSDEAARLGRAHGGQAFVDRYPKAETGIGYSFMAQVAVCKVHFYSPGPESPSCGVDIYIHAETGALMARDLSCLSAASAPGVAPRWTALLERSPHALQTP